jgi:hypothetical protein
LKKFFQAANVLEDKTLKFLGWRAQRARSRKFKDALVDTGGTLHGIR